jgi:hypothetical protein
MRLDTQPLLVAAARLSLAGFMEPELLAELRADIVKLEGQLVTKQEHAETYEQSRAQLVLDGTALAWARWRAENVLLTMARADVERLESKVRFEMERLECEVARAQQKQAQALAGLRGLKGVLA